MAGRQLRIYYGPDDVNDVTATDVPRASSVSVPLCDILMTLVDAVKDQRGWLKDFEDDQVTISTDLYEVLLAYQHYHRPSA